LVLHDPKTFGGIWIKTSTSAHMDHIRDLLHGAGQDVHRVSPHVDMPALVGGIDPISSLSEGRIVMQTGILQRGGTVVTTLSERLPKDVATVMGQAMDTGKLGAVIAFDEGSNDDAAPPQSLTDRLAFCLDLTQVRAQDFAPVCVPSTGEQTARPALDDAQIDLLVTAALRLGIVDLRPVMMCQRAAEYLAQFDGNPQVTQYDLDRAAALVFAHRAVTFDTPTPDDPPPEENKAQDTASDPDNSATQDAPLPQDMLIDAIKAHLPPDLLASLMSRPAKAITSTGMGFGLRQKSNQRGRPKPPRLGRPSGQDRIDVLTSVRSAAPWQPLRRRHAPTRSGVIIYPSDLHVQRFENRTERLVIFVVDASGSAAMNRMGEAKGAVELMLAHAYTKRDYVSLIGFRDTRADVLLPPTRSLVQTKKNLAALAAGGGTPLALGIDAALALAITARRSGKAASIAVLTDGKGNIDLNGNAGRQNAMQDATLVARKAQGLHIPTLFIDCGRRANPELATLADTMQGKYINLPRANAQGIFDSAQAHLHQ